MQPEWSGGEARRHPVSALAVWCVVPDRRDGLARRRTMQLQRTLCRQLERADGLLRRQGHPADDFDQVIDASTDAIPPRSAERLIGRDRAWCQAGPAESRFGG